jgi:hypothetical protein
MFDVYEIFDILSLGAPLPGFIYATRLRFYKCPSRIRIGTFLLRLQVNLRFLVLVDGWRVVDDDDYGQAVGNPKRKV